VIFFLQILSHNSDFVLVYLSSRSVSLTTAMATAADVDAEIQQALTNEVKLFNRWTYDDVTVNY